MKDNYIEKNLKIPMMSKRRIYHYGLKRINVGPINKSDIVVDGLELLLYNRGLNVKVKNSEAPIRYK